MDEKEPLILALETGIRSGGVAIVRGRSVLFSETGGATRADVILTAVRTALERTGTSFADLDRLAVSIGPGSYTGLRIGIATAIGLGRALDVPTIGVPVLEVLANSLFAGNKAAVVPFGRGSSAVQYFVTDDRFEREQGVRAIADEDLTGEIQNTADTEFVISDILGNPIYSNLLSRMTNVQFFRGNLAELVGLDALKYRSQELKPIYL